MHEAGHVMLADALGVGIERVWITGLYDATINPQAGVKLVSGGCALSKAIVIALAGHREFLLCEPNYRDSHKCWLRNTRMRPPP